MKAIVWHKPRDLRVDEVPDPVLQEPTDAIIRVTATAICGSDLHLFGKVIPGMLPGDILGHEAMGMVEEVGADVSNLRAGDRVVVPFNVSCGHCFMCASGMQSQCETTQNRTFRKGASLFGYTHLYGGIPGGQAEYLRVPMAHYGPIKVEAGLPDRVAVLLADVLPTSWQAVEYAQVPVGGTLAVYGLGAIGQLCARIAQLKGAGRVIGIDGVPERLRLARSHGVETIDFSGVADVVDVIREMTHGRGADSVIDAVGMEASGSRADSVLQAAKIQPDKLHALRAVLKSVRRGGTVSISGVYLGWYPALLIGDLFDRQVTIRMGQANVRRWTDDIMAALQADVSFADDLVSHELPLEQGPEAYKMFQTKRDGAIKIVLRPAA